jgi:hypothetical protein
MALATTDTVVPGDVVTGDQVRAIIDILGLRDDIALKDIQRIEIAPTAVIVTTLLCDGDGKHYRAGSDIAKTVTTLPIRWA